MNLENFNDVISNLKSLKVKKLFVQFPEGLRYKIQEIIKDIEKHNIQTILSLEPLYGACDIKEDEARRLGCDAILCIAHYDYGVRTIIPVFYWAYFYDYDPLPILEKEWSKLEKYDKIGLVTSLQFVKNLPKIKNFLEKEKGKKVFIGKSTTEEYPGQMLGCRIGAGKKIESKVDVFLSISAGKFYPLGLALATKKPVLNLDLEAKKIYDLESLTMRLKKIEAWNLAQFKDAKKIGLLVSWKRGQIFGLPFEVKKKLEEEGKEVYILAMDDISEEKLRGLKLDFLISFACPRIAIDDLERFKIPIINYNLLYKK